MNVRTAGFPASAVLRFASPELTRAVDAYVEAVAREQQARKRAIGDCLDARRGLDAEGRKAVGRLLNRLRGRGAPSEPTVEALQAVVQSVRAAVAEMEAAWGDVRNVAAAAAARTTEALLETARDPRFGEAVIWQNRTAFHSGIEWLLRQEAGSSSPALREKERLVASYLQRYAVKNDTIGFFGPEGVGRIVPEGPAIVAEPGPTLLARRSVYFEYWAIEALAGAIALDPELRRWLAPRRMPTIRLEGDVLHPSVGSPTVLAARDAKLLRACDGRRSAASVAALIAAEEPELADEAMVFAALDALVTRGWLIWTLEVPTGLARPERALREALEPVAGEARARALGALDELEHARDQVTQAAGDAHALDLALDAMERSFTRRTRREATQNPGRTYAGRTLVYEDCLRNLDLRLGPAFLERIGPPLRLLLASARWYTYEIATRYEPVFRAIHHDGLRSTGSTTTELSHFLARLEDHLQPHARGEPTVVAEVVRELQAKWSAILELGADAPAVERSAAGLRERALAAFAAPHPGWPMARHSSPDLLIVARGLEQIRRGDYRIVLGELHAGVNTCMNAVFVEQHPHPEELVASYELDVAPTLDPVLSRFVSGHRTKVLARTSHDIALESDATKSWRERDRVLPIAELFVTEEEGRLAVRHRGSAARFDLMDVVQVDLMLASRHLFEPLPVTGHASRVSIDDLVLRRESWRFAPEECAFARASEPLERFVGARRWARAHGLPRFVFAKIPEEKKPWYVDLESEVYVELLAKMVRGASSLGISEMLPSVEEVWLPDQQGEMYVAELRLAAVDPEPWRPAPSR